MSVEERRKDEAQRKDIIGGRRGTHPTSGRSIIEELWANSFLRRTSKSPQQ